MKVHRIHQFNILIQKISYLLLQILMLSVLLYRFINIKQLKFHLRLSKIHISHCGQTGVEGRKLQK